MAASAKGGGGASTGANEMLRITPPATWAALLGLLLLVGVAVSWAVYGSIPVEINGPGVVMPHGGVDRARAASEGVVTALDVDQGDRVTDGQVLATLSRNVPGQGQAADTVRSVPVVSPVAGTVLQTLVTPGDWVETGDAVATLARGEGSLLRVWLFVPFRRTAEITRGMKVLLVLESVAPEDHGFLLGMVHEVGMFPATDDSLADAFGQDERWLNYLLGKDEPVAQVWVDLVPDRTPTGYRWTLGSGPDQPLRQGMACRGTIVVGSVRPITLAAP